MPEEPVAVVGIGQTKHVSARRDVSIAGLVREAAVRALEDAALTWADIDAVVIGKAPDFFEGLMMPELYLADALGAVGKPMLRVHTAGSVGGSTALVAANLVSARVHRTVLTLAFEKQSESNAMWGLSLPIRSSSRCWPEPAASSPRTCGRTCAAPARPTRSAPSSRTRTAATR